MNLKRIRSKSETNLKSEFESQQIEENFKNNVLSKGNLSGFLCKIRTQIPGTVSNLQVMERYKKLTEELCIEPKKEQILYFFT